jgi:4-diphosphocytidyl-2-C-methyl-D-erythritol kinase
LTPILLAGELRMHVRRTGTHLEVLAPAKLNLFLEVLARRPDGFHEIETLLAAAGIYDTLAFAPLETPEIELESRWSCGLAARLAARRLQPVGSEMNDNFSALPAGPDHLAWKAAALLRERAGEQRGARMTLVKRIPAAAGLGGASSDAAAALVAANLGWNLGWSGERLADLAAELGSDVPFFLTGGAAMCRGRGERIEPLRPAPLHVVVVRPPVGLSTPQVYSRCRPADRPASARDLHKALECGNAAAVGRGLANRLQAPAAEVTPWIDRLAEEFTRQDCLGHQMSGSGSSYFGIARHARHAKRVASRLRARQIGTVFAAATAGA